MGYLELDHVQESLWIFHHGVEDMHAWQNMNGLPRDKVKIKSGSVTVEQTSDGLLLYCVLYVLTANGEYRVGDDGRVIERAVAVPYVEPIPEGIGKLIDWDYQVPKKHLRPIDEDAA